MRAGLFLLTLALLLWTTPAAANSISLGSPSLLSATVNQINGNSADRGFSSTQSGGGASVNMRAQASADHGITTNADAIVDVTFTWSVPYTVSRTVGLNPCPPCNQSQSQYADLLVPIQQVTLAMNYSGRVANDDATPSSLQNAVAFSSSVSSGNSLFSTVNLAGASIGGANGSTGFSNNGNGIYTTSVNQSGPGAGEISFAFQIPTNYQDWDDFASPFAVDYFDGSQTWNQTLSDTLTVSFRLRAESRPSGSISTTGGEAIACAGQGSGLSGFDLDDGLNCGTGVTINASVAQTGTTSVPVFVPEPTTLFLLGGGLAGLAALGRRRS
jgi:hypothetical protein